MITKFRCNIKLTLPCFSKILSENKKKYFAICYDCKFVTIETHVILAESFQNAMGTFIQKLKRENTLKTFLSEVT